MPGRHGSAAEKGVLDAEVAGLARREVFPVLFELIAAMACPVTYRVLYNIVTFIRYKNYRW